MHSTEKTVAILLPLLNLEEKLNSRALFSTVCCGFFNYAGKTGTLAEAGLRITAGKLRMAWMRMPRAWKRKEMGHPVLHTSSAGFSLSSYF